MGDGVDRARSPEPRSISRAIWTGHRRWLTVALLLNVVASAFEALAVATILPSVVRDLGGIDLYGQAFSAFLLASLVGIALAGAAADARGMLVPMLAGTAVFVAGLVVSGTAPSMRILVAGRALQGLGSGAISAIGYSAIGRVYPVEARPRMLALLSSAWVVPGMVGPAVAGFLAEHVGWRLVFLGITPLLALAAGLSLVPLSRLDAGEDVASGEGEPRPDRTGAGETATSRVLRPLALAAGSGLFLEALASPARTLSWLAAPVGLVLALPALRRLLPEGTLRLHRGTPAAIALVGAIGFAFFGVEAFLPLALSEVRGGAAAAIGIPLTAGTLCWTIGSWIQAREAHHRSRRTLAASGVALVGIGILLSAAVLGPTVPVWLATAGWAVAGLGMGLAYSTTALVVLEETGAGSGRASAALQLAWALGIALGTGLGGAILAAATARGLATSTGIALADAMALAVLGCAGAAALRLPAAPRDAPPGDAGT